MHCRWDANYHYDNKKKEKVGNDVLPLRAKTKEEDDTSDEDPRSAEERRAARTSKEKEARAEAAVAKARACAAVDAMRTLSLDSPLGSSELEPRLQPRSEDRQHLAQLEPARGDETAEALLGSPTGGRLGRQGAKAYSGHRPAGSLCGVDSHASEQAGSSKRRPQEKQLQLQLAALTRQQSSRLPPQELQRRQHRCLRKRAQCLR